VGTFLGLQAQEAASQVALRNCSKEVGEGVGLHRSLQQRGTDSLKIRVFGRIKASPWANSGW